MAFFAYLITILVTASSLILGFEWLVTPHPLPDQPAKVAEASHGARQTQTPLPPRRKTGSRPEDIGKADTNADTNANDSAEDTASTASQNQPHPSCDIHACTLAYRSFRASDCTYQPYEGPRRLCTKTADRATAAPGADKSAGLNAHAQAPCDVTACARHYRSFDPATCTYQPYRGPRRLCGR